MAHLTAPGAPSPLHGAIAALRAVEGMDGGIEITIERRAQVAAAAILRDARPHLAAYLAGEHDPEGVAAHAAESFAALEIAACQAAAQLAWGNPSPAIVIPARVDHHTHRPPGTGTDPDYCATLGALEPLGAALPVFALGTDGTLEAVTGSRGMTAPARPLPARLAWAGELPGDGDGRGVDRALGILREYEALDRACEKTIEERARAALGVILEDARPRLIAYFAREHDPEGVAAMYRRAAPFLEMAAAQAAAQLVRGNPSPVVVSPIRWAIEGAAEPGDGFPDGLIAVEAAAEGLRIPCAFLDAAGILRGAGHHDGWAAVPVAHPEIAAALPV